MSYIQHLNLTRRMLAVLARASLASALAVTLAGCAIFSPDADDLAAEAASLIQQNRVAEARIAIDNAIELDDSNPEYYLLKGQIEFRANAPAGAFGAFNNALALDPSNQSAMEGVYQLGLQTGNLPEALAAAKTALALNPRNKSALVVSGLLSIIRKKTDEADEFANRILTIDPSDEGGVILKARAAYFRGQPQEAFKALDAFTANRPDTQGIVLTRLEIYRAMQNRDALDAQFRSLRKLDPENLEYQVDEANFRFKIGQEAEALTLLGRLLANPKLPPAFAEQAISLWREYLTTPLPAAYFAPIAKSGAPQNRISVAHYLLEANRNSDADSMVAGLSVNDAQAIRAESMLRSGQVPRAEQLIGAMLENDPTHCGALALQSQIRFNASKFADAKRIAQQAAVECNKQLGAWKIAAYAYDKQGDAFNARRIFQQAAEANPQNTSIYRSFVEWLLAKDMQREAVAAALRLTRNAPALISGWQLYGETCRKAGQSCTAEAEAGLARARTIYGVDLEVGQAPPNGLFGRIVIR